MSKMPKTPFFDLAALDRIKSVEDVIEWLKKYNRDFLVLYKKLFNQIENGGASTANWNVREATAADVTAGKAKVAGDLIVEHKTNGTKREFEQ